MDGCRTTQELSETHHFNDGLFRQSGIGGHKPTPVPNPANFLERGFESRTAGLIVGRAVVINRNRRRANNDASSAMRRAVGGRKRVSSYLSREKSQKGIRDNDDHSYTMGVTRKNGLVSGSAVMQDLLPSERDSSAAA